MKITIPVDEIDLNYYQRWLNNVSSKQVILNLQGDNFLPFINNNFYCIITTSNYKTLDLTTLQCNELNIININETKEFWYDFIEQNQLLIMNESSDIIICTHKNIQFIYISLNSEKILEQLYYFTSILTEKGIINYKETNTNICYKSIINYVQRINQYWTDLQKRSHQFLQEIIQYNTFIKKQNIKLSEIYKYYYTNIQNIKAYFNFKYIDNNDNIHLFLPKAGISVCNFYNKIVKQIGNNITYTPIYTLENKVIINEYRLFTIPTNTKRLCIELDQINKQSIKLIIPKEMQTPYINKKLNLNYINDTTIITDNCVDIYIILMYYEKLINHLTIQGEKIESIEGFIDIQNN